jgi:hypothetical protein
VEVHLEWFVEFRDGEHQFTLLLEPRLALRCFDYRCTSEYMLYFMKCRCILKCHFRGNVLTGK